MAGNPAVHPRHHGALRCATVHTVQAAGHRPAFRPGQRPAGASSWRQALNCARDTSCWPPVRCTCRTCRRRPVSSASPARCSIRRSGITAIELAGKRIASIGTGGSAIQYCPRIAPAAAQLHVFQRTPAWVIPRDVRTYSEAAKKRFGRFDFLRRIASRAPVLDQRVAGLADLHPALARGLQRLGAMEHPPCRGRRGELARKLTPDYRSAASGC